MLIRAYLDTCIVSGLAKEDLTDTDAEALLRILEAAKAGHIELVTSEVTSSELSAIPEEYRRRHEVIYNLIADVPRVDTFRVTRGYCSWV